MENSSKALIMAGEILIAIIIISILAAVIVSFGRYSSDMHTKISDQEIYQFNNNFISYSGRVNITSQEIATLINFAKKENDKNNLSRTNSENSTFYIEIWIDNKRFFQDLTTDKEYENNVEFSNRVNRFIKENNLKYYRCQATFKTPIKVVNEVKEIWTVEDSSTNSDIGYDNLGKINYIKFHVIKDNTDESKTYDVTDPIVVNPYKE